MYRTHLWNKDFFLLWQGQFISLFGTQAFMIAIVFTVKDTTESPTLMGLLMMTYTIPTLLAGPIGGVFADHYSRKNILISCDIISGLCVGSLALILYSQPDNHLLITIWLFIIAIILGTVSAFFRPAISACMPDLVPDDKLDAANSISQASIQSTNLLGPPASGMLYSLLGAPLLLLIDAITYLFSAISECFITILPHKSKDNTEPASLKKFIRDSKAGFHYLVQQTGMKEFTIMMALLNFFVIPCTVLLPFYIEDYLGIQEDSATWYGYMIAIFGIGAMLGYLLAALFKFTGKQKIWVLTTTFTIISIGIAMAGMVHTYTHAAILMMIIGACAGYFSVITMTILQQRVEKQMRGRVFGLLGTLTGALSPIAMGLSGIVFDLLDRSIPTVYISIGVILALLGSSIMLNKNYREFFLYEAGSASVANKEN